MEAPRAEVKTLTLWFRKEPGGPSFCRCVECGAEERAEKAQWAYVRAGNDVLGLICGKCFDAVKLRLLRNFSYQSLVLIDSNDVEVQAPP